MTEPEIAYFDQAMGLYMSAVFGGANAWRSACHRAAKIAAMALKELYPSMLVRPVRVELLAYMDDGMSYAHFGYRYVDRIEGQFPMHWAVQVGEDLYDATFWQLRNCKTPLALPDVPYFFSEGWFTFFKSGRGTDADGVTWVHDGRTPGLNVGYLIREDDVPPQVRSCLMPDEEARMHARMVRVACGRKVQA